MLQEYDVIFKLRQILRILLSLNRVVFIRNETAWKLKRTWSKNNFCYKQKLLNPVTINKPALETLIANYSIIPSRRPDIK